jgi:hypothetical protein
MSHNINKVNAQEPNRAGEISQDIGDLADVSSTAPTDNYYLQWDATASEWQPAPGTAGSTTTAPHIWLGEGASQTYPESWSSGNGAYFYSTSVVNTISGASVGSSDSYSNWYDEFTLPTGTYFINARVDGDFATSSGQFRYLIESDPTSGAATSYHPAPGWSASSANTGQNPELAQALFEISEESVIRLGLDNTASLGTASTNQGLYGYIFIMKVG